MAQLSPDELLFLINQRKNAEGIADRIMTGLYPPDAYKWDVFKWLSIIDKLEGLGERQIERRRHPRIDVSSLDVYVDVMPTPREEESND